MESFLVLVAVFTMLSAVTSVKEWKNFENGIVYSHKMPVEKEEIQAHESHKSLVGEERLLHSRHRDKKMKASSLQSTDAKLKSIKNPGRHHKMSVEEEMHLRPLKERHHKFPNPASIFPVNEDNPLRSQTNKQNLVKKNKHFKTKIERSQRGRRDKKPRPKDPVPTLVHTDAEMSTPNPPLDATAQYSEREFMNFFDP